MLGGSSFALGRIFGIRIGVNASWFLILFLFIFWLSQSFTDVLDDETAGYAAALGAAVLFFGSILLHELGHALAARRSGIEVSGIDLFFFGGVMKMSSDSRTPGQEFKIAIAGPLVTLGIVIVGALAAIALLGAGGRATRLSAYLGQGFAGLLILYGLYVLIGQDDTVGGLWAMVLGYLLGSSARAAIAQSAFSERLAGVTVADIMDSEPVVIPADLPAARAWEEFFLRYQGWPWFAVVEADGRFAGIAHRAAVESAAHEQSAVPVRELAADS